jgi:hypothetical protein
VDQNFSVKHHVYGRLSYKNNPSSGANALTLPSDTLSAKFWQVSGSWTYAPKPNLLNEARIGYVKSDSAAIFNFDGRSFTNGLGLKDIQKDIFFNGLPNFSIDLYTGVSKGRPGYSISDNIQFIDNLTWVKGKHTLKFGGDVRNLRARSDLGFTATTTAIRFWPRSLDTASPTSSWECPARRPSPWCRATTTASRPTTKCTRRTRFAHQQTHVDLGCATNSIRLATTASTSETSTALRFAPAA